MSSENLVWWTPRIWWAPWVWGLMIKHWRAIWSSRMVKRVFVAINTFNYLALEEPLKVRSRRSDSASFWRNNKIKHCVETYSRLECSLFFFWDFRWWLWMTLDWITMDANISQIVMVMTICLIGWLSMAKIDNYNWWQCMINMWLSGFIPVG